MKRYSGSKKCKVLQMIASSPQISKGFRRAVPMLAASTATFFTLAMITGLLLSANFVPALTQAHSSTQMITNELNAGWLIRGIHWWASSLTLITSMLFTAVAYWFGAYRGNARWLWWSGLAVGLALLGANVTGYYLPMDQNAYWRLVIEAKLFGEVPVLGPVMQNFLLNGLTVNPQTVVRVNWLHTLVVPVMCIVAFASHIYAARKNSLL
jgi:quinol-cytochrome oxidoreductase complex cytochrome b subunit